MMDFTFFICCFKRSFYVQKKIIDIRHYSRFDSFCHSCCCSCYFQYILKWIMFAMFCQFNVEEAGKTLRMHGIVKMGIWNSVNLRKFRVAMVTWHTHEIRKKNFKASFLKIYLPHNNEKKTFCYSSHQLQCKVNVHSTFKRTQLCVQQEAVSTGR